MNRDCPICATGDYREIERFTYSDHTHQLLVECLGCGMVYASESPEVDYGERSKYAAPGASGSGESAQERIRLDGLVTIVSEFVPDPSARVLDIGCAQGGLLEAFGRAGFINVCGIDPSPQCVDACVHKGLNAELREMDEEFRAGACNVIVLSHVLEHVWNPAWAVKIIEKALAPEGIVYIETPNALRYSPHIPFMETNREHINHFSLRHLMELVESAGLRVEAAARRDFVRFSTPVPSIYVVGRKTKETVGMSIRHYLSESLKRAGEINAQLEGVVNGDPIVVWGYGEFAQTLLRMPALKRAKVVQIVDGDSGKWGMKWNGLEVESPEGVGVAFPILIASVVNKGSIRADIKRMKLTNEIIEVG